MINTGDAPDDHSLFCSICKEPVELINTGDDGGYLGIIVLRVGCRKISSKHGKGFFQPDEYDDGDEEKIFHFHCLQTIGFDFADAGDYDDLMKCVFCDSGLYREAMYYEMELGRFDLGDEGIIVWIPDRNDDRIIQRTYACWDCVFDTMGEGHTDTARYRLGMIPLGETSKIDYSEIEKNPKRSFKSRRTPPKRQRTASNERSYGR